MNILLFHNSVIPPSGYGGIERVVYWLAREFDSMGHQVWLMANAASNISQVLPRVHFISMPENHDDYVKKIPPEIDIIHFHENPSFIPAKPFMVTIHGNGSPGERFLPNTVFLSKSHAQSHNAEHYVYNGVPLADYSDNSDKEDYMLFLANLNWRVKNGKTAVQLALDSRVRLYLAGGKMRDSPKAWGLHNLRLVEMRKYVKSLGKIGGDEKHRYLRKAAILFYCVNWNEPFALAPHEALASGTPVLASKNGALSEYIEHKRNGYIITNYDEALQALKYHSNLSIEKKNEIYEYCRKTAFSSRQMALDYIAVYDKILRNRFLYDPERVKDFEFRPGDVIEILK